MTTQDLKSVYDELGIVVDELGCIMMETQPLKISDLIEEDQLYFTPEDSKVWINGIVSEWNTPHITLLWGLLQNGNLWKPHVDKALEGWALTNLEIQDIGFFESNDVEESYYCIMANVKLTDNLKEGNFRLRMLPHIDSFADYIPHITLCYIKKDETVRDELISKLNERFANKKIKTTKLNYGRA